MKRSQNLGSVPLIFTLEILIFQKMSFYLILGQSASTSDANPCLTFGSVWVAHREILHSGNEAVLTVPLFRL